MEAYIHTKDVLFSLDIYRTIEATEEDLFVRFVLPELTLWLTKVALLSLT